MGAMFVLLVTCLGAWILLSGSSSGQMLSSSVEFNTAVSGHEKHLDVITKYIENRENQLKGIKDSLNDLKEFRKGKTVEDMVVGMEHPITAFRFLVSWAKVHEKMRQDWPSANARNQLGRTGGSLGQLFINERLAATTTMFHLQRYYNISVQDLADGIIQGLPKGIPLDGEDAYNIGFMAEINKDEGLAAQWYYKAKDSPLRFPVLKDAWSRLARTLNKIGDYDEAHKSIEKAIEYDASNKSLRATREKRRRYGGSVHTAFTWQRPEMTQDKVNVERLCQGEDIELDTSARDLTCRLRKTDIPYVTYREEILSSYPYVSLIHDVTTENETETVVKLATPKLSVPKTSDARKMAWLGDGESATVKRVSQKLALITGLDTKSYSQLHTSEYFQVANYGFGGNMPVHDDLVKTTYRNSKYIGNRMATVMLFLSDVEMGGNTIFPILGVHVKPIKNAALFWYNLDRSGLENTDSQHADCPVLAGHKWIANKFIHEGGQEFRRPCGTSFSALDDH